jgi:DNA-binding NarL/FixJ family response regulator
MQQKTRIALIDDHGLFRKGIANLLSEFDDIEVVFDAANGIELQKQLPSYPDIDVLLMDITMPQMDGYAATAWVRSNHPLLHVLALSMFDEDEAVIGMLRAGAGGYVLKESSPAELHRAIKEIKDKGIYINEMVSGKMLRNVQGLTDAKDQLQLTERETEFIQLCASELTYKEIADKMNIAPRSVENYRENIFEKLQIKSRVGLVLFAIKHKIIAVA